MPDEKMENKIFDQIIGDKLHSATQDEVQPQWRKMKRLLRAHGFRHIWPWYYFLFGALALSIALNVVFIIGKQASIQGVVSKSRNQTIKKRHVAVVIRDTLYITDTVYVHHVMPQKQSLSLSNNQTHNPPAQNRGYTGREAGREAVTSNENQKTIESQPMLSQNVQSGSAEKHSKEERMNGQPQNNITLKNNATRAKQPEKTMAAKQTKTTLVYQDRRIKKQAVHHESTINKPSTTPIEKSASPVKKKKLKGLQHKPSNRNQKLGNTKPKIQVKAKKRKNKKSPVVHFNLGIEIAPYSIITKGVTGSAISYGIKPEIKIGKRLGFYTGLWFVSQKLKFNGDLMNTTTFASQISDPSNVYEVHSTTRILKIPLGIKVYAPLKGSFLMNWSGAINYLHYNRQDFKFEMRVPAESSIYSTLSNTYSGFGSVSIGLGASYIWRDKLEINISPQIEIPMAKLGVEKIKYRYFITQFTVSWHL